MTRRIMERFLGTVLAASAGLASATAAAQSYGLGDQTLTIGADAFRPYQSSCAYVTDVFGYISGPCGFYAPLSLPEGAHITQMCAYLNDPDGPSFFSAGMETIALPAGGQAPLRTLIDGSVVSADFDIGYGTVCTGALDYVMHTTADFEHQTHHVYANTGVNATLGGVRITWRRQVSPLPASSSFDDVPLGSTYSQFIEALKAANITGGCQQDPPLYCPDRPITRAEMAVYLSLALGLHWVD